MAEKNVATVAQLAEFDEVIDARSPSEFAEDHLPEALSCPVLDDLERARVGTLYTQVSPFEARKLGAAIVARNIARHLETRFIDRARRWRPLVYCWRGGKRSGAFVTVLRQVGWDACQLDGGYKAYRRWVVDEIERLAPAIRFRIVSGATGSGKSRLLQALAEHDAQVLDLEALAQHKGSVLGELPEKPQPSQKMFESRLCRALAALDPARDVFVEAESRKIGGVQLPDALIATMRAGPCVRIETSREARVRFLLNDYEYFTANPQRLRDRLECLRALHSAETLACWRRRIDRAQWPELVGELLEQHYDPLYQRSQGRNYALYGSASIHRADELTTEALHRLAGEILSATRV
jgi:tRNA 2-selenouridine synthase